jgi:hypothetical protein
LPSDFRSPLPPSDFRSFLPLSCFRYYTFRCSTFFRFLLSRLPVSLHVASASRLSM